MEESRMKPAATETNHPAAGRATVAGADTATPASAAVVTRMKFAAPADRVWDGLLFYEQIEERPPLHLRLLLPVPTGTQGPKAKVGDEAKCSYERGHLLKRVTQVDPGRHYGFEVAEQNLDVGRGLALAGGCYTLRELPGGATEVAVTTRYVSHRRPAWLWERIEATVCHMFHRHLLSVMRRKIEAD
jgi:hypothetical protein